MGFLRTVSMPTPPADSCEALLAAIRELRVSGRLSDGADCGFNTKWSHRVRLRASTPSGCSVAKVNELDSS